MPLFHLHRRVILALSLLLALLFSQSARSAGTDPVPSAATTVTVSVTLTGKDANGVPFSTVRSLDIPLAGTPDAMAVNAALNGAASGGEAYAAFALDGPAQALVPSATPGHAAAFGPIAAADDALPDLARPTPSSLRFQPRAGGFALTDNDATRRFTVDTETSQATGTSLGLRGAVALGESAALGGGARMGHDTSELYASLGLHLSDTQRLMLTGGQLRQHLDYRFPSGKAKAEMTQNSAGAAWRVSLGSGLLDYAEATAYTARTASHDLADVRYTVDTAALYELWNDPRRIAGSRIAGVQGKLGLRPWEGGRASFGFGQENLRYDLLNGEERHTRATGSVALEQTVGARTRLRFGADSAAAQNRVSVGVGHRFDMLGMLGLDLVNLRGRDGIGNDNRVQLSWNIPLGRGAGAPPFPLAMASADEAPRVRAAPMRPFAPDAPDAPAAPGHRPGPGNDGLLDQVATRPTWMPAQVVAKVDTSAGPTRLIAVDKTALPAGSTVDTASGAITTPLGVAVTGIAGVTRNAAAFVNAGQFALAGNSLVINPGLIVQPAAGVVDTYVVTANNVDGGTTLITVNVSHGSVKIDRIEVTRGTAAAAPTASTVAISGTAQVGQTLTGSYTYADANGNAQGTSTFRWLRNGVAIASATASTYTLVAADQGHPIRFEVTPISTVVPTTGTPTVSIATGAVAGVGLAAAPTASAVSIAGTARVGQQLTGSYTYADANADAQGTSAFRWLRNGVAIAGATASSYTLVAADQGNTITFEVSPIATVAPTTGTPVVSSATATVVAADAAPTASAVSIAGTAQVGQTLTGQYTYADANADVQGTSTFRWLRNGVAISGATAITYTPVAADIATTLTFEVTPVSTVAPTTGIPVISAVTAAVTGAGTPAAPTASTVSIAGTAQVGQVLTGYYTYADANGDPQGTSTFRWLRNGSPIAGATAITYPLVNADYGNTITFEVTPVSTVTPISGTAVASSATATVVGVGTPAAPTASAVAITGTAQLGQLLTGSYTYADANADPQGTSTFRWLRNGSAIDGATAITYTPVAADIATTLSFEVTPVSTVAPATGTPVVSAVTAAVLGAGTAAAPTASAVSIAGTAQVGQTLTGSYTYADANGDAQGASTFRWLRSGVAIAGATASTYTLVVADQGNTITFEVTPVATVAPITGTAVVSAATAVVLDTTPDAFTFVDQTNVPRSTLVESAAITVAGLNAASAIMVIGGEYQINGGAWTTTAGSISNGQTVKVRHTSSAAYLTATNTTLSIGGISDIFTATTLADLPAGYVYQNGLTWMPVTLTRNWAGAEAYCAGTINGQTGWRMPSRYELSALYASGAMNGQGWTFGVTWSSTPHGAGVHEVVYLVNGSVGWTGDAYDGYVSCVR